MPSRSPMVSPPGPGSAREPKTTAEMWSDLARDAWKKGEAAADPAEACTWLERARRIVPADNTIALSLALARLRGGDNAGAMALFELITAEVDLSEAWLGLAATSLRMGNVPAAVGAMQAVLSRHASSAPVRILSANVATAAGLPGWCALDSAGRLHADGPAELRVDGAPVAPRWSGRGYRLPPGRVVSVSRNGVALLGSPIDRGAIDAVEGFVGATMGDLVGWVWHPHNPDRDPGLLIAGKRIVARELMDFVETDRPLARPRRFRVAANDLPPGPVAVTTEDGQALLGSPLDPGLERRSAPGSEAGFMPVWADVVGPAPRVRPGRTAIDVVIPVHGGREVTLACLDSVLPTLRRGSRVHVVDDAGPDPLLAAALDRLASRKRIVLHRLPVNRGFPGAANVGLQAASGRDVVLLNSDTIVPPGWIEALAEAAYSAADIGSACPLSNDATILSYPDANGGNPLPNLAATAALARRANGAATVDIPVAVGFCMFIRHDCLADVGWLREDLFAQGYGEENDWSLRARHHGWRHVAVPGCFVAHHGGASFGGARRQLLARNAAILNRLHPGYDALIAAWIARDPLGPARRRIDVLRWRAGRQPSAVALITHAAGGGVDRVVTERAAALRQAGIRPIMIRPDGHATLLGEPDTPNLRYRLPDEWDPMLRLLRRDKVERVELHHMLGHDPALFRLADRLGIPQEVFIHDYASFCARISLVPLQSYCGEPPVTTCRACVADYGSNLEEVIDPPALVERSAALLESASRVVVPSADVATRIRRHFPAVRPDIERLEDDSAIPPPPPTAGPVRHICVVGGIGVEKGYDVLLGCVRDAALRQLPLRFTVVGFTQDDARLFEAGPVFITGRFERGKSEPLIRQQNADIAFIPSIWPETWCFALGEAWRAGLRALVFDLGAPAERVRRTGWGHVLPLGLAPSAINDWVVRGGVRRQS